MTKKHLPGNDGLQQSLAEAFADVQQAITNAVAKVKLMLERGLAEVLAVTGEKTWPLMMRGATAQQKAKFRELLLKTVQGQKCLSDEDLLNQVSAAVRKASTKPRRKNDAR